VFLTSETNFTNKVHNNGGIYISNFNSYTLDEKWIREKLMHSFRTGGYLIVDNIEKSLYYLIFNFNPSNSEVSNDFDDTRLKNLEFILIKSSDRNKYFNSEFSQSLIIWRSRIKFNWIDFLKKNDKLMNIVVKNFLKTKNIKVII